MYIKDLTLSYDKTSKREVFPAHAMKTYTGSSSIVPLILNLATIRKQVFTFHNLAGTFILPGKNLHTHWTGGWVGSRVGLDILLKMEIFLHSKQWNQKLPRPQT